MTTRRSREHLADRVSLYDLKTYLAQHGWQRGISKSDRWTVFRLSRPDAPPFELVLPGNENYSDARVRISEAVSALSQIEAREVEQIGSELVSINSDALLIRLEVSENAESIPVADATRHIRAIRNLLLYSGCSELQPKAHFEEPIPASLDLLNGFEFCHTFRGSFGFEVTNTLIKEQNIPDLFAAPIRRRMLERIARGVKLLEVAVENDDPNLLIQSYARALNARMCDSLSDIGIDGEVKFGLEVDWATTLPAAEDVRESTSILISEVHVSLLQYASEQLKIVPPQSDRIIGQVVNLHCAADPTQGNAKRTVAVKVDHSVHGSIEIKLSLGPDAYLLAIEAHSKGKKLIASGQLQRKGNTWTLDSLSSVETGA